MKREEYLASLGRELRRLPKEDYDEAMAYFIEYLDEAGPDNEQQAFEDLGSPQQAAEEIIMKKAQENLSSTEQSSVKKGFSKIWVGILAVFAAPIALPVALAVVIVICALAFSVLAVVFSLGVSGVALTAGGIATALAPLVCILSEPASVMATTGLGLVSTGLGILVMIWMRRLFMICLRSCMKVFGRIVARVRKDGRKNEKE